MAKKHVHKYYKVSLSGSYRKVWACGLSDCNHYMPDHMREMVNGKKSLCWSTGCENELVMDPRALKMDKPLCQDCDPNYLELKEDSNMDDILKLLEERGK